MYSAFISYSSENREFAQNLKESLKNKGISVKIDYEEIKPGDNLERKIKKAIENTNVTITIVSKESLDSPWVIWEFVETLKFQEGTGREKFIPISLDKLFLKASALREITERCDKEIKDLNKEIEKVNDKNQSAESLQTRKDRWFYLRQHIDCFLKNLNNHSASDFSKDEDFESNVNELVKAIKEKVKAIKEKVERSEKAQIPQEQGPPLNKYPDAYTKYFTNRKPEQQKIIDDWQKERAIIVVGRAGMGKSALACHILYDPESQSKLPFQFQVEDVIYLDNNMGTGGLCFEELVAKFEKKLGKKIQQKRSFRKIFQSLFSPQNDPKAQEIEQLLDLLNDKVYIIFLDNMQDLIRDGDIADKSLKLFIEESLKMRFENSRGTRFLITSYASWPYHERICQVNLEEELSEKDSIKILREENDRCDNRFKLREISDDELREVLTKIGCIPLGLKLLLRLLDLRPWKEVKDILTQESFNSNHEFQKLLGQGGYGDEARKTFDRLLDSIYQKLDHKEQLIMEALAVFRDEVPPEAIRHLLERINIQSVLEGNEVDEKLKKLEREKCFIDTKSKGYYRLRYSIDQKYAYSLIEKESKELPAWNCQDLEYWAADYYHTKVSKCSSDWKAMKDLYPELKAFDHLIKAKKYQTAAKRLLYPQKGKDKSIIECLWLWGNYQKIFDLLEKLRHNEFSSSEIREDILGHLGEACQLLDKPEEATNYLVQALKSARKRKDPKNKSQWLCYLGNYYARIGKIKRAISNLERSLNILDLTEINGEFKGIVLHNLAECYAYKGDFDKASCKFKKAADIFAKIGRQDYQADSLCKRGSILFIQKNDECHGIYEKAKEFADLTSYREIQYESRCGLSLVSLSNTCLPEEALTLAQEAIKYYQKIPGLQMRDYKARALIGIIHRQQGKTEKAKKAFETADKHIRKILKHSPKNFDALYIDALYIKRVVLYGLALCSSALDERDRLIKEADESYQKARAISTEDGLVYQISQHLFNILKEQENIGKI